MNRKVIASLVFILFVAVVSFLILDRAALNRPGAANPSEKNNENEENEAVYQYQRWKYEADLIKDPTTG